MTWAGQPDFDRTVLDYQSAEPVADKFRPHLKQFDITSLVRSWYDTGKNYGIELRSSDEALRAEAYYITSNNSAFTENAYPSGLFYYKNTAGLEGYWSYHEQAAGRAGSGYTNDFNGNVVFVHGDAATTGERLPVSVSHVYNLCRTEQGDRFGNGWSLNVCERLDPTGISQFPYVYTDGDGTKHYFYQDSQDGNKLKDEDGLGYTITATSSDNRNLYRTITRKDQSRLLFDTWGALRQQIDPNGNIIRYEYGPNTDGNYIKKVVDPTGAVITFNYSENQKKLLSIKDETAGRTTGFQYDGNGNLTAIVYPDGTKSTYSYDGKKLTQAKAPDGYAVEYRYVQDFRVPRVRMFRERGTGGTIGRSVEVSYRNGNTTVFQYPGLDGDTTLRADNPVYSYDFDSLGRPLTVYDEEGNASSYRYYEEGRTAHKLKESGELRASVFNYLTNPGFDTGDAAAGDKWAAHNPLGHSDVWVIRKTDQGYSGNTSIQISRTDVAGGLIAVRQDVTLPAGTYTLSAYRKTEGVRAVRPENGDGACLGVVYLSGSKNGTTEYGEAVSGTTAASIDGGWQRTFLTFTVPSGGANIRILGGLKNAGGKAWFDSFQLEEGDAAEGYNLALNGGFEFGGSDGSLQVWTRHNMESTDGRTASGKQFQSYGAKITGAPGSRRYFRQVVNVSGPEGDVYNLSGWAKANAVPGKEFRLGAEIRYSDGSRGWRYFEFDPYLTHWQFAGGMFTTDDNNSKTDLTYTCLILHAFYGEQMNTAWFDGIHLTKDEGEPMGMTRTGTWSPRRRRPGKEQFRSDGKREPEAVHRHHRHLLYLWV